MARPTKSDKARSPELSELQSVVESRGVRLPDEGHPLSGYPSHHLRDVIRWCVLDGSNASMVDFIATYSKLCGYPVTERAVRGWLADSRGITDIQLARIADIMARILCDEETCRLHGRIVDNCIRPFTGGLEGFALDAARGVAVDSIFSMNGYDRADLKRLAMLGYVMGANERELDAMIASARVMGTYAKENPWAVDWGMRSVGPERDPVSEPRMEDIPELYERAKNAAAVLEWAEHATGFITAPEAEGDWCPF